MCDADSPDGGTHSAHPIETVTWRAASRQAPCPPGSANIALGDRPRRELVGAGQEHAELVALEPSQDVVLAQAALQAGRDALEDLVADGPAELVVDGPHPVDVEAQDGVAVPRARAAPVLALELFAEAAKVRAAR